MSNSPPSISSITSTGLPSGDETRLQGASDDDDRLDTLWIVGDDPQPDPGPAPAGLGGTLPVGTRLAEFEITGLIGQGGFGIVYRAHDHSLGRDVAIKEFMPLSLAVRGEDGLSVRVRSHANAEVFGSALRSFMNEARLLAQFDHPSLVKVFRFWEVGGTACMAMPLYRGMTLWRGLEAGIVDLSETGLKGLLAPLLEALETIHAAGVYHRDISPDNILILADGRPLLLDFGAARQIIGDGTQNVTSILKPGYAPIEQYAGDSTLRQGPWTDIYALAAVLHFVIMGVKPEPSVGRMLRDSSRPLADCAKGRFSEAFLHAIDHGFSLMPEARPRSVADFRLALGITPGAVPPAVTGGAVFEPAGRERGTERHGIASRPASAGHKRVLAVAAPALIVAVLAGAFVALRPADNKTVAPSVETLASAVPPVPRLAPAALQSPTAAAKPVDLLEQIYLHREAEHTVTVLPDRTLVRINKDRLRFGIRSDRGGYLYVFMVGTDGQHVYMLFPNELDKENRMTPGVDLSLPRRGWAMEASGPPGTNHFVAVVADQPRELSAAGLVRVPPFAELPLSALGDGARLPGRVRCDKADSCSEGYGAASFSIEETDVQSARP